MNALIKLAIGLLTIIASGMLCAAQPPPDSERRAFQQLAVESMVRGETNNLHAYSGKHPQLQIEKEWVLRFIAQVNRPVKRRTVSRHSAEEIISFLETGAQLLVKDEANLKKRSEADKNVDKLFDALIKEADRSYNGAIGENSLRTAKGSLCPLWPFC